MAYATNSDCAARYGEPNILLWCDMEGLGPTNSAIATRRAAAIAWADAFINARLKACPLSFQLPLDPVPTLITHVSVLLFGYYISTARGVRDFDEHGKPVTSLYVDYLTAQQILEDIVSQKMIVT